MRVIGLDYGEKTVGIAISDSLGLIAQPLETVWRKDRNKLRRTCARIEEVIKEYQVERIVVGFPRHLNNDAGEQCDRVAAFSEMIGRRTGLPVEFVDERLTTVAADRVLMEYKVKREERKQYIDKLAAAILLQGYLDRLR